MKETFLILTIFFSNCVFSHKESLLEKRLVHLEKSIKELDSLKKDFYSGQKTSKYEFEIKNWNEKIKGLKPEEKAYSYWEEFFIPLLSLIIPIATAIVAGFIAISQTNKNGIWALKQSRSNTIATARIEWMQKLRGNLSEFSALVASINYYLTDVVELNNQNKKDEAKILYAEQIKDIVKLRAISTEIKLQLNIKETIHKDLETAIDNFVSHALEESKNINDINGFTTSANEVLDKSRIVLKDVWEQAKNEGNDTN